MADTADDIPQEDPAQNHAAWEQLFRELLGESAASELMQAFSEQDPRLNELLKNVKIPTDPTVFQYFMQQMKSLLENPEDTSVNWELCKRVATESIMRSGDPMVSAQAGDEVRQALQIAQLWLDVVTCFPPTNAVQAVWDRRTWVEKTLPRWKSLVDPLASQACAQISKLIPHSEEMPTPLQELNIAWAGKNGFAAKFIGAAFGQQMGETLAALARESLGAHDLGLSLLTEPALALLPANIASFSEGLASEVAEVRQFWAVREAASARLYAAIPWLSKRIEQLVHEYATLVDIDTDLLRQSFEQLDPNDIDKLQDILRTGVYTDSSNEKQQECRAELECLLALVEGWVSRVTFQATVPYLSQAVALEEMLRRRRAAGGPAEKLFANLVGLELRPRLLREATRLWELVEQELGVAGRDELWSHRDFLPVAADLAQPESFLHRRAAEAAYEADVDAELAALLAQPLDDAPSESDQDDSAQTPEGFGLSQEGSGQTPENSAQSPEDDE